MRKTRQGESTNGREQCMGDGLDNHENGNIVFCVAVSGLNSSIENFQDEEM